MMCRWNELLSVVPGRLRRDVDRLGRETMTELRLRLGSEPELVLYGESRWLPGPVTGEDLAFCISAASRYSPWAAVSMAYGYLTAPGGHRMGICGDAVVKDGFLNGIRNPRSVCIRVARDFPGIGRHWAGEDRNLLILGPPGQGKTTLLRDIARCIGERKPVAVADERGELFPEGVQTGKRMDVLTGAPKAEGISMLLRTMGPQCIAVDEITAEKDCCALLHASFCGVQLLATAHAGSVSDLYRRPAYRMLTRQKLFDRVLLLRPGSQFTPEEVKL